MAEYINLIKMRPDSPEGVDKNSMTKRTIGRQGGTQSKMTVTSFEDLDQNERELKEMMDSLDIPLTKDPTEVRLIIRQRRLR